MTSYKTGVVVPGNNKAVTLCDMFPAVRLGAMSALTMRTEELACEIVGGGLAAERGVGGTGGVGRCGVWWPRSTMDPPPS